MRTKTLLVIVALFFLSGCTKMSQKTEANGKTVEQAFKEKVEKRALQIAEIIANYKGRNKITKSHARENAGTCNKVVICHNGHYISVNKNAVAAHLAHGDKLTCCTTSCINQSAELLNSGPFEWYYDGVEDDCFGFQNFDDIWVAIGYPTGFIAAESYIQERMTYYLVYTHRYSDHSYPCFTEVTESEYECARNYLQSYITANPCIPNLCNL